MSQPEAHRDLAERKAEVGPVGVRAGHDIVHDGGEMLAAEPRSDASNNGTKQINPW